MRRLGRSAGRVLAGLAVALAAGLMAAASAPAQQPPPGADWQTGTRVEPPAPPPNPAQTTVVPRAPAAPKAVTTGELVLEAFLSDDGQPIEQGLIWHVYKAPGAPGGDAIAAPAKDALPQPVGTYREARPRLRLPPGRYQVVAAFGRAYLTQRLDVRLGGQTAGRFVINAGGLRVEAVLIDSQPVADMSTRVDVLSGEPDQSGERTKVITGAKPGQILRLNAGIYQIVSTYGDTNSIVRADVTVEAGKLTEAKVKHLAAKIIFKLVTQAGGDALADTKWSIRYLQGPVVRESAGALPTHVLAAGAYEVEARHGERGYKRTFLVEAGNPLEVEIVIPAAER